MSSTMEALRARIAAQRAAAAAGGSSTVSSPAAAAPAPAATAAAPSAAMAARIKAAKILALRKAQAQAAARAKASATESANGTRGSAGAQQPLTAQQRIELLKAKRVAALREQAKKRQQAAAATVGTEPGYLTPRGAAGSVNIGSKGNAPIVSPSREFDLDEEFDLDGSSEEEPAPAPAPQPHHIRHQPRASTGSSVGTRSSADDNPFAAADGADAFDDGEDDDDFNKGNPFGAPTPAKPSGKAADFERPHSGFELGANSSTSHGNGGSVDDPDDAVSNPFGGESDSDNDSNPFRGGSVNNGDGDDDDDDDEFSEFDGRSRNQSRSAGALHDEANDDPFSPESHRGGASEFGADDDDADHGDNLFNGGGGSNPFGAAQEPDIEANPHREPHHSHRSVETSRAEQQNFQRPSRGHSQPHSPRQSALNGSSLVPAAAVGSIGVFPVSGRTLPMDVGGLCMNELFADVEFSFPNEEVQPGDGPTIFPAHRIILSTLSEPLFSRIQSLSLEPSSVNPANMVVKIEVTDVEVNVFKTLLRFFYHRKMEALSTGLATIEFCLLLLSAAEQFCVQDLVEQCYGQIKQRIDLPTVAPIVEWAYNKNNHEMLAASLKFLETLTDSQYRGVLQKKRSGSREYVISSVNAMKMFRRRRRTIDGGQQQSPLKVGVTVDRADVVEYLLAHGENVNQTDANDETVLHFSASLNSFRSCKLFIEAGAEVNLISKSGYSPLHLASENGASDIVELLLSHKAVADVPNHKGQTALHVLAMSWDNASATKHKTLHLVDRLLTFKANVAVPDFNGKTALHHAAAMGSVEMIGMMIDKVGTRGLLQKDREKQTPLHYAAEVCSFAICKLFIDVVGIGSSNPTASTAKFINIQNRAGLTALHVACTARARQEEAAQVVKALVQGRADLSLVTKDGENVIHTLARHSSQRNTRTQIAEVLCKFKANVNAVLPDSLDTALHIAMAQSNYQLAKLLVKSGALTCPLNANRETPMAFVEKGTSREADLLGSIVDSPLIRERVRDDDSTECQQCFNKFSFSRKKVGCRHCGAIVCRSCTKKKPIRKYGLDRDQVVCDQCARFLGSSYSSRR